MKKYKVGQILNRVKDALVIEDEKAYKRLTIRMYHKGVCLRDIELGENIGTKNQFRAQSGQFIMSRIDARNGAFGIIPEGLGDAAVTNDFLCFTVNEELVDIDFFELYSQTNNFMQLCTEGSKGTTNRKRLKEDVFLGFEVYLPEKEKQIQIVKHVKNLQLLREKLDAEIYFQNIAIQNLRQSILLEAIQGNLVQQDPDDESASVLLEKIKAEKVLLINDKKIKKEKPLPPIMEDDIPYELPSGWEWVRLTSICSKLGAGSTPTGGKNVYSDTGVKFIRSQNVWNGGMKLENIAYITDEINKKMQGSIVKANDILLNITGASIGRSCIVDELFDTANVNQHVSIIRLIDSTMNKFIHMCIISPYIQSLIMEVQVGVSREGLSMDKLGRFLIPVPPLKEQKRITEKVDRYFSLCDEIENVIGQSKQKSEMLMQTTLKEVFSSSVTEDKIVEFPSAITSDFEEWEIAARSDGMIESSTKAKIKSRVTELLNKSQR